MNALHFLIKALDNPAMLNSPNEYLQSSTFAILTTQWEVCNYEIPT